ncbi:MAG TPA: Pvc16 family protein [Chloroflexota bacterium]|nr:Pvc16 family protein [Chloroflexota bacterium]
MFADLDETIRQILIRHVPLDPTEVEISFDTPDRDWSGRLTRPAVNCFLYDVRENVKLRVRAFDQRRDSATNEMTTQRTPMRVDATYQVSAWARVPEDEHRLLWRVLNALMRYVTLPTDYLHGALKDQPYPIGASVAQPDQMPANYADLWQALDNRIRPVLTYVVTLAIQPDLTVTTPLTLKAPSVQLNSLEPAAMAAAQRIHGRVRDRQDPTKGVEGALVLLWETGDRALTDEEGRFTFARAPRGPITLVARAAGRAETSLPVMVPATNYDLDV